MEGKITSWLPVARWLNPHVHSLDKYIRSRGGLRDPGTDSGNDAETLKRKARMRRHSKNGAMGDARSVHLLNQDEILSLFSDIMSGLAFLHSHNMLHLDIKAENILLHRFDGDESFMYVLMTTRLARSYLTFFFPAGQQQC